MVKYPKSEWAMSYLAKKLNFCFKAKITHYPFTFRAHDHILGRLTHALIYQNLKRNSNLTHCVTCNFNSSPFLDTLQFSGSHAYQN